jgi:Xaa-Pro aminopeptidase
MSQQGLAACILPSADPHLSEYLPAHWQIREAFSGFTGSAGTLLVTAEAAVLQTDGRYWIQADAELAGSGIEVGRINQGGIAPWIDWLVAHTTAGAGIALDGRVLALAQAALLRQGLIDQERELITSVDLAGLAWVDRPPAPASPIWAHRHAGATRREVLDAVAAELRAAGATHHFIASLDDVAWLTRLRGSDVEFNPVFCAHLLLHAPAETGQPLRGQLFVDSQRLPAELADELRADGIELQAYEAAAQCLNALSAESVLWLDPKRVTWAFRQAVPDTVRLIERINPSQLLKSRKTALEVERVREAMELDGAAMCRFYARFEAALGRQDLSELTVDEWLSEERARLPGFVSLSFPTIAGFNANGAMPHYRATPASHARISTAQGLVAQGLLLIDSGAQYLGGTTDITRVWPIGTPSAQQCRDFTRVLRGTINLSRACFPQGLLSPRLDALARAPLWQAGLDYGHGTGHGVGYCLNVHEGPQSISGAQPDPSMAMMPGMITSIEPALYRPGRWGIRIENLVLNTPAPTERLDTDGDTFGAPFLAFETLTLCPIDARCIDTRLLSREEIDWVDSYHAEVRRRLLPHLVNQDDGPARDWLNARTQPLVAG